MSIVWTEACWQLEFMGDMVYKALLSRPYGILFVPIGLEHEKCVQVFLATSGLEVPPSI